MTGDHPHRDRSRRASLPWRSPVGRDKWHAKSPAQGKCPAILPHGPTSLRDVEGVSVPTFTFIDEAWVAIHRVTSLSRSYAALSTGVCAFGAPCTRQRRRLDRTGVPGTSWTYE